MRTCTCSVGKRCARVEMGAEKVGLLVERVQFVAPPNLASLRTFESSGLKPTFQAYGRSRLILSRASTTPGPNPPTQHKTPPLSTPRERTTIDRVRNPSSLRFFALFCVFFFFFLASNLTRASVCATRILDKPALFEAEHSTRRRQARHAPKPSGRLAIGDLLSAPHPPHSWESADEDKSPLTTALGWDSPSNPRYQRMAETRPHRIRQDFPGPGAATFQGKWGKTCREIRWRNTPSFDLILSDVSPYRGLYMPFHRLLLLSQRVCDAMDEVEVYPCLFNG